PVKTFISISNLLETFISDTVDGILDSSVDEAASVQIEHLSTVI
ncbi:hypothetical protein KIPB_009239, partial [Kipferlia bialata]